MLKLADRTIYCCASGCVWRSSDVINWLRAGPMEARGERESAEGKIWSDSPERITTIQYKL